MWGKLIWWVRTTIHKLYPTRQNIQPIQYTICTSPPIRSVRGLLPFYSKGKYVHFAGSAESSTLQLREWTYLLLQLKGRLVSQIIDMLTLLYVSPKFFLHYLWYCLKFNQFRHWTIGAITSYFIGATMYLWEIARNLHAFMRLRSSNLHAFMISIWHSSISIGRPVIFTYRKFLWGVP